MRFAAKILAVLPIALFLLLYPTASGAAQERLTDDQLKSLMGRIEKNAEAYRSHLRAALNQTQIDDTKSEKNINQFVKEFEQATDRLKDHYSKHNTNTSAVEELLNRAAALDGFMLTHRLTPQAQEDWMRLRDNLDELARAYQVAWNWTGVSDRPFRASTDSTKSLIGRLENNADRFRDSLKKALNESRLDGSDREDNINQYVKDFEHATNRLKERFNDERSAVGAASEVLRRGTRIDRFMQNHALNSRAQEDWRTLRSSLDELARSYNVAVNWQSSSVLIEVQ